MRKRAAGPAVWLALLALWLQALLPAVHHPGGMSMGRMSAGLCLAAGNLPATPHDKEPDHKLPPCQICQSLQILAAGYMPPAIAALPVPTLAGIAAKSIAPIALTPSRRIAAAQARAPPFREDDQSPLRISSQPNDVISQGNSSCLISSLSGPASPAPV